MICRSSPIAQQAILVATLAVLVLYVQGASATPENNVIVINRKTCRLLVQNLPSGRTLLESAVGLGKGGIGVKGNMADCITPRGRFRVDLILYKDERFNSVSKAVVSKYHSDKRYGTFFESPGSLSNLFASMNSLDFNGDGKPDAAYGQGYVGLDCPGQLTGPKMSSFHGKPYWFSIGLHGTPDERNIGRFNSGGCVQVPAAVLQRLIESRIVQVGSEVLIE